MTTRYAIISDTHFVDASPADDFGPEFRPAAQRLRYLCRRIRLDGDTLILNGDIGDMWQAEEDEIVEAHRLTIDAIRRVKKKYYIVGNHDSRATGAFLDCEPLPYLVLDGIFFEHGDAHDWWITRYPMLCERITRVAGWLERRVHKDSDVWAAKLWRWLSGTGRYGGDDRNAKYLQAVCDEAWKRGCRTAVFGHTHMQEYWPSVPLADMDEPGCPLYGYMSCHNTGCFGPGGRFDVTRLEV